MPLVEGFGQAARPAAKSGQQEVGSALPDSSCGEWLNASAGGAEKNRVLDGSGEKAYQVQMRAGFSREGPKFRVLGAKAPYNELFGGGGRNHRY